MLKYRKHVLQARIDRSLVTGKRKLRFTAKQENRLVAQGSLQDVLEKCRLRDAMQERRYAEITCVRK